MSIEIDKTVRPSSKRGGRQQIYSATEHVPCVICNGVMIRREKESPSHFQTRKTCNDRCLSILRGNNNSKYAIPIGERYCDSCGEKLERHGERKKRRSCDNPLCQKAVKSAAQAGVLQVHERSLAPAPDDEGLPANAFSDNVVPPDNGIYLRLIRPDDRTYGGVSI